MNDDPAAGLSPEILERYRLSVLPPRDGRDLLLPENVARFLEAQVVAAHPPGEYLGAVFVDAMVSPLGFSVPYLGYLGSLKVDPRTFLAPGVLLGAAGFLLFHHRPKAPPRPTRRDVQVAKRARKAGEVAGVRLLDYLLLGDGGWTSLQEAGRVRFRPLGDRAPRDGRARVKPQYRDPERPGHTWSGRGNMARWLEEKVAAGARLEDFAVEE